QGASPVVERASVSSLGEPGNAASGRPDVSANGRYVAFQSLARNLVPDDHNGDGQYEVGDEVVEGSDVFVRDLASGTTERVSVARDGSEAQGDSGFGSISADGERVAFESNAPNLTDGDGNAGSDIFVLDRVTKVLTCASVGLGGGPGNIASYDPA